ncbi:methyltransferase domain-containing protein [Nocardioides sp. dk4132]|uniref:class I SAM-dependent methyltransferase n=1 Tax=unclassified Nocardioides TaxID=2615069 RepID=UPI0012955AB0|nr:MULTISPECIES: methyltransferase domain-containing protein [unclassified Nocardioides]MQW76072.1 methyltransferase domain-containing protein [Nocardioides sp. dk4132]QGA08920.1 methyltransferase domain-containing protein [Nocardioides sp. dk884]
MPLTGRLRNLGYDAFLRVDTGGIVETDIADGCHAATCDYTTVATALQRLEPGPDDVLVDIGCGKGRVVCVAARMQVGRVIGLDLGPAVVRIASDNLQRLRGARSPAEVVLADAVTYDYRDVTCAYLFNPFEHFVLDRVLMKIRDDRAGRPFRCLFLNLSDVQRETFTRHDWLTLTDEGVLTGHRFAQYRSRLA